MFEVKNKDKIAFGGGCHWCTEAVFQYIKGVEVVEQGFVAGMGESNEFSEAIIVHYNPEKIGLARLVEIHLLTHSSSSNHTLRSRYRSAIYAFGKEQQEEATMILQQLQAGHKEQLVTRVYLFQAFKPSAEQFIDYYKKDPEKPFCKTYIEPKMKLLWEQFGEEVKTVQ